MTPAIHKTVYTFSILRNAAWAAYNQGNETIHNSSLNYMNAQLNCAFCMEAYLNHLGKELFPFWETIEKKLSPREKLDILTNKIGLVVDFGARPFQTFDKMFKYRNTLVHGKTTSISKSVDVKDQKNLEKIEPFADWQTNTSQKMAKQFLDDSKTIIFQLQKAVGMDEYELFVTEDMDIIP